MGQATQDLGESPLAIKPAELPLTDPTKRVKELPVCVSEQAFYEDSRWLETGFELLKRLANYKRDYLLPRLRDDMAGFDKKMAGYDDAMVATAALLARLQPPGVVSGFWTEHSESSVLPTALSMIGVQASQKDLLGRWKPEGCGSYGGRARSYIKATLKPPGWTTACGARRERDR